MGEAMQAAWSEEFAKRLTHLTSMLEGKEFGVSVTKKEGSFIRDVKLTRDFQSRTFELTPVNSKGPLSLAEVFTNPSSLWKGSRMLVAMSDGELVSFESDMQAEDLAERLVQDYERGPTVRERSCGRYFGLK